MENDKKPGSFYSGSYGERRKKRHRKGQSRMNILLVILVILVVAWLILPNPTGSVAPSDPAERTRAYPATEGEAGNTSAGGEYVDQAPELLAEDTAPNPLLEEYIDQELRESPYRFEITYPNKEAQLTEQSDGTHLFRLAGNLYAAEEDENEELSGEFRIHLFSNKPEDYESFQPIFTEDLVFQVEGDHFVFQLSHPEDLDPGLYYYLIEEKKEGEVFVVGKVMVL